MAKGIVLDQQSVPGSVGQTNPLPVKEFGGNIVRIAYHSSFTEDPEYIGLAVAGSASGDAVWQIKKIAYAGAGLPTSILYEGGNLAFDAIWNNRESLSFS